MADLFPYEKLGRAMGWMFGGIAGGMAFGSTFGAWLNPYLGWRNEFIFLAAGYALLFAFLFKNRSQLAGASGQHLPVSELLQGYKALLTSVRGSKTFTFIFFNGLFHGGVFSWLGYYLTQRYQLDDAGIGRALLGYGIPGMLLGPVFGRLTDYLGRNRIIPFGLLIAAACAFALVPKFPLWIITIVVASLSIGLDLSHPPMTGIISSLDAKRRGQAMGLNTFLLFIGLGAGSVIFQYLIVYGLSNVLLCFGGVQLIMGLLAIKVFNKEKSSQKITVNNLKTETNL